MVRAKRFRNRFSVAKKSKRKGRQDSAFDVLGAFDSDETLTKAAYAFAASTPLSYSNAEEICTTLESFPYEVRVSLISRWAAKHSCKDPTSSSSSALIKIVKEMTKDTPIFDNSADGSVKDANDDWLEIFPSIAHGVAKRHWSHQLGIFAQHPHSRKLQLSIILSSRFLSKSYGARQCL